MVEILTDVGVDCQSPQGGELIGDFLVALREKRDNPADLTDVVGKDQAADENHKDDEDSFAHVGDSHIPKADCEGDGGCPVDAENVLIEPTLIDDSVLIHPVAARVDEGEAQHEGAHHMREEEVGQQQLQQSQVLLLGVVVDENQVDYLLGSLQGDHVNQTTKVAEYSRVDLLRVDYHEEKRQEQQKIEEEVGRFRVVFGNFLNFVDLDAVNHLADHEIADNSDADAH